MKINEVNTNESPSLFINPNVYKAIDHEFKEEELKGNIQDREERKKYADKIFWFLVLFMTITLTSVFISIFKFDQLSDTVIVTLLTTTSANVISIFAIVVRYLFRQKKS
jgi:hypothetical protein